MRFLAAIVASVVPAATASAQLRSRDLTLTIVDNNRLEIRDTNNHTIPLDGPTLVTSKAGYAQQNAYETITAGQAIICHATDRHDKTVVDFVDTYSPGAPGTFVLKRDVIVKSTSPNEAGFRTDFSLRTSANAIADADIFIPGIWYCDTAHVPPSGRIADNGQPDFLYREDRLPIPLTCLREKSSGLSIAICEPSPAGETFVGETTRQPATDARMKFGSLGLRRHAGEPLRLVFAYPGVEDQPRFHPLVVGAKQTYSLLIHVSTQPTFDDQLRDAWRTANDAQKTAVVPVNLDGVYAASIDLLSRMYCERGTSAGFPFLARLPLGKVDDKDVNFQMGFVGQQLPNAAHLIDAGLLQHKPDLVKKGERICDFWAAESLSPAGVPRVWFDTLPKPHWRKYDTYTRIATDGVEGLLRAYNLEKSAKRDKPAWLAYCRNVGDWYLKIQNENGSFYRSYDFDGKPVVKSESAALHPVRFLLHLSTITGEARYRDAAIRAGKFAVADIGATANYYGGTADNDDVKDKEAGWIALDSFLALYEATNDKADLDAAKNAADFTETWTYCWNVPVPWGEDPKVAVPRVKSTAGLGLIATGHSGADMFMAYGPFAFYRLYVYTADPHYLAHAKLLMNNPRQFVDVNGSLGYGQPGLVTEALSLSTPRGHGVNAWLPWCTAAILDGMQPFKETFGTFDIDTISKLPFEEQKKKLNRR